jgi:hypothetical protein
MTADIISLADRRFTKALKADVAMSDQAYDKVVSYLLPRVARNMGIDISDIDGPPARKSRMIRRYRKEKGDEP